jgi:hypothetical protein
LNCMPLPSHTQRLATGLAAGSAAAAVVSQMKSGTMDSRSVATGVTGKSAQKCTSDN